MSGFDRWIVRVRFKKVLLYYLAAALIVGAVSLGVLGYIFRGKLQFAYNYMSVSEKVEKNKLGVDNVKDDLTALAENFPELADILVLDSDNRVTFSAKNKLYPMGATLRLKFSGDRSRRFLADPSRPDITYWLVKNTELAASSILFSNWAGKPQNYTALYGRGGRLEDEYFFERNFNNKQVFLLSYVGDRATGDKIYFISDVQPVENSGLYVRMIGACAMLLFMAYWVLTALWIYADALRSKLHAPIWGVIAIFTNLAGVLVYLLYKQNNQTCFRCAAVQGKNNVYCTCCGAKLSETCKECGYAARSGDRYCKSCGAALCDETDGALL